MDCVCVVVHLSVWGYMRSCVVFVTRYAMLCGVVWGCLCLCVLVVVDCALMPCL